MIVLKVLVVIIIIEAVAIMVLGIIRGLQDLRYGSKEPKIVKPEGEPYTMDLSGLQPWDTEHVSKIHQDKPDGGIYAVQYYMKNKEAKKNDRETKADN